MREPLLNLLHKGRCLLPLALSVLALDTVASAQTPLIEGKGGTLSNTSDGPVTTMDDRLIPGRALPSDAVLRRVVIPQHVYLLLRGLGSPDWSVRDKATRELATPEISDRVLLAAMLDQQLGIEQRSRLLGVLTKRVLEAPRGAVGIRMRSNIQGAVVVEAVIPGMPGERFLKRGDRIVFIEGRKVTTSEDLTSVVQSRQPGDILEFQIERRVANEDGVNRLDEEGRPLTELLDLQFPLGSIKQLDSNGNISKSSQVSKARQSLANGLRSRFGLAPLRVRTPDVVEEERSFINRPTDEHPAIQWLLLTFEQLDDGDEPLDATTRRLMERRLGSLVLEASDSRKSDVELAWLQKVIERFEALCSGG